MARKGPWTVVEMDKWKRRKDWDLETQTRSANRSAPCSMGVKDLFQLGAVYEHSLALQQQCNNVCYHREQSHVFDLFV